MAEQLNNPQLFHPRGAYITLQDLVQARFFAHYLHIRQRRKALTSLVGTSKSQLRGRGIDFDEVRAYQAGDDIRSIDWRITARTGRPYTKLFSEERERPLLVVVDQRQSLFFGSQYCFKSVMACYLAALIAWSGLQQQDRVGGLIIGNDEQYDLRPRRSRRNVLALLQHMLEFNQQLNRNSGVKTNVDRQRFIDSLVDLRRIAKPGSAIFLISDFTDFYNIDPVLKKHLYLLSRHCEVTALAVYDPLEQHLPPVGRYTISDGYQRQSINLSRRAAKRYHEQFTDRQMTLQQTLGKLGIPLITVGTEQAPLQRLLHFYGTR